MAKTKGTDTKEYTDLYYDEEGKLRSFVSAMASPSLRVRFDKQNFPIYEITTRINPSPEELLELIKWMRHPPVWITFSKVQLELPGLSQV